MMTAAALSTVRALRTLGLPGEVLRKITIATDGRPDFTELQSAPSR